MSTALKGLPASPTAAISTLLRPRSKADPINWLYASHTRWPLPSDTLPAELTIAVLDSSFNPPQLGHLALALQCKKADAQLLMLSSKNVDKKPKEGDAGPAERGEMMREMALAMERKGTGNTAVGVFEEPTFVGKSTVLKAEIQKLLARNEGKAPAVRLVFMLGYDTLIRFFAPSYYPSGSYVSSLECFFKEEGSTIICARRSLSSTSASNEDDFLESEHAKRWKDYVEMCDLPEKEQKMSSTRVRQFVKALKDGDDSGRKELEECTLEGVRKVIRDADLYTV